VRHSKWIGYLDSAAARSREEFVIHFFETYKDPLPIWIAIELWDFWNYFSSRERHEGPRPPTAGRQVPDTEADDARKLDPVSQSCEEYMCASRSTMESSLGGSAFVSATQDRTIPTF